MHGISNQDTHLHPLHISSVHLTKISEERRSGRITGGMRSGWRALRDFVLSSPTSAPTLLKWPCQEQRGSGLTASAPLWRFRSRLHTRGIAPSAACECGSEQTVNHVGLQCPLHRPPHGLHGLMVQDDDTIEWLPTPAPRSSAAKQWTERTGSNDEERLALMINEVQCAEGTHTKFFRTGA